MVDVHDKKTRSYNASIIRSKNTTAEMIVRKFLYSNGFRYRIHSKKLIGKPDIVLAKYKTIVDIRGCFWHGHKHCKFGDGVNTESLKYQCRIEDAKKRDVRNEEEWIKDGWNVIIVWDRCELEDKRKRSSKRELKLQQIKAEILANYESTSN